MIDKVQLRHIASILPKASAEADAQDKIVPNGNRVIQIRQENEKKMAATRVNPAEPVDRVRLNQVSDKTK